MIKTTIKIDGMACGMCEAHVNDALRKVIKAKKITSSHKKKEAVVVSENELNEEEMKQISSLDMGYSGSRAKHFEPDFVRMVLNNKIHD